MDPEMKTTMSMPVLALRGLTLFPNMLLHFDVGRDASIRALDRAMSEGAPLFLVAQKDLSVSEPGFADLYPIGTISQVRQILRLPGDNVRVMVEGSTRGRLLDLVRTEPYLQGEVEELEEPVQARNTPRTEALIRSTYELFEHYVELSPRMNGDVLIQVMASDGGPGYAGLTIVFYLYRELFQPSGGSDIGVATAVGWVLALFIAVVVAFNFWGSKKWVSYDE